MHSSCQLSHNASSNVLNFQHFQINVFKELVLKQIMINKTIQFMDLLIGS